MSESHIVAAILLTLGQRPDLGTFWRQNTGQARSMDGKRIISFGVPGCADISGITPAGVRVEVEAKTATGRQSDQQKAFQRMIERRQGLYALVRSADEAVAAIEAFMRRPVDVRPAVC